MNETYSELLIRLGKALKKIWDNDNFIMGVLADVWNSEEDQLTLLRFIEAGEDVNVETVSVLAMDLGDRREGK